MPLFYRFLLFTFGFGSFYSLHAQHVKEGVWRGAIHYDNIEVPFNFVWKSNSAEQASVIIQNGEEQIPISNVTINGDSINIPLHVFDSELKIKYIDNTMTGEWHKNYRATKGPLFTAEYDKPRFKASEAVNPLNIDKKWKLSFQQPMGVETLGVGLLNQIQNKVTGTILTEVGDYRFFEGIIDNDSIKMSSFDGVHAFLFLAKLEKSGITGKLYFEAGYAETFKGAADENATIQDPFEVITIEAEKVKPYYDILTAGSEYDVIDTDSLVGKVVIIQLMGTWCPNSYDQSGFLANWYKKQDPSQIKLIAVTYEPGDKEYALKRITKYTRDMQITYPMYVGGSLSKGQAALAFPNMDKINAFPTLVLIDKKGYIRYIDSYFNGPATGQYYQNFIDEFNEKVNELLNE